MTCDKILNFSACKDADYENLKYTAQDNKNRHSDCFDVSKVDEHRPNASKCVSHNEIRHYF